MNTKLSTLSMSIALSLVILCHSSVNVQAALADKIIEKIASAGSNPAAQKAMCQKGDLFGLVVSVRSLKGAACTVDVVAAFAEKICPSASDTYMSSECHGKAGPALQGKTPDGMADSLIAKGALPTASKTDKLKATASKIIKSMVPMPAAPAPQAVPAS